MQMVTMTRAQYEADIREAKASALHALADEVFGDDQSDLLRWHDFVHLARTRADEIEAGR